jgi:tRNA (guanine-N7-)-methyltransferase
MRPKDLKSPFTWETRQPAICDRILYVPKYYNRHHEYCFPKWESPEVFGRVAPIEVEYCSGNGAWIVEKAIAHPERNWVAVEIQFDRARKIWSKVKNFNLPNLLVVCGEAETFTKFYVPRKSFAAIYVNFPDPWPKDKHAKKRLLKEPFLTEMARASSLGAVATIATDHAGYTEQVVEGLLNNPSWEPCFEAPHFVRNLEGYGTSYFDALWQSRGLPVHYVQFRNRGLK